MEDECVWAALEGKRVTLVRDTCQRSSLGMSIIILALSLEPVREITRFFLICCRESMKPWQVTSRLSWKPCFDLASAEYSIAYHGLQHLSMLLAGTSKRIRLLCGAAGHRNWTGFCASPGCKDYMLAFRRAVLVAAAFVHERHHRRYALDYCRSLARLGDGRLGAATRNAIAAEFQMKPRCCVPFGFPKALHKRCSNGDVPEEVRHRMLRNYFSGPENGFYSFLFKVFRWCFRGSAWLLKQLKTTVDTIKKRRRRGRNLLNKRLPPRAGSRILKNNESVASRKLQQKQYHSFSGPTKAITMRWFAAPLRIWRVAMLATTSAHHRREAWPGGISSALTSLRKRRRRPRPGSRPQPKGHRLAFRTSGKGLGPPRRGQKDPDPCIPRIP